MMRQFLIWIALLVPLVLGGLPAVAQTEYVEIGKTYPPMFLRVCKAVPDAAGNPSADPAQRQAAKDREIASQQASPELLKDSTLANCAYSMIAIKVVDIERTIAQFVTWTLAYDRASSDVCNVLFDGGELRAPCSIRLQPVRYYKVNYQAPSGNWYIGYAQIPQHVYALSYLADPNR